MIYRPAPNQPTLFKFQERKLRFKLTPKPEIKQVEKDVVKDCLALLDRKNYAYARIPTGTWQTLDRKRIYSFGAEGMPDYLVSHAKYPGFYLETKRTHGPLSPAQKTKIWELTQGRGFKIVVADRIEVLLTWLAAHEAQHEARQRSVQLPLPHAEDWMAG